MSANTNYAQQWELDLLVKALHSQTEQRLMTVDQCRRIIALSNCSDSHWAIPARVVLDPRFKHLFHRLSTKQKKLARWMDGTIAMNELARERREERQQRKATA